VFQVLKYFLGNLKKHYACWKNAVEGSRRPHSWACTHR